MAYSPAVEQWRALVSKHFKPQDVDKALHVIQWESNGSRFANGDNGSSHGLFQMNQAGGLGTGYSVNELQDAETNIRLAAAAVYGGSGWAPWGEGTENMPPYDPATGKGKFGALGNHPYEEGGGGPVGTSGAIGNYDADAEMYWQQAEQAWQEFNEYRENNAKSVIYQDGNAFFYDEDTAELVFDPVGSRIVHRAIAAEDSLTRLSNRRDAGIGTSGVDAAQAYLTREKEKAAEATRKYENFIGRISDLVALEDLPTARAMSLASALNAANEKRSRGTFNQLGAGMGQSGQKMNTDFSKQMQSIRSSIPEEAPSFYEVNPDALGVPVTAGGGGSYPVSTSTGPAYRSPQDILAEASTGYAPTLAEDRMPASKFNVMGGAVPGSVTGERALPPSTTTTSKKKSGGKSWAESLAPSSKYSPFSFSRGIKNRLKIKGIGY